MGDRLYDEANVIQAEYQFPESHQNKQGHDPVFYQEQSYRFPHIALAFQFSSRRYEQKATAVYKSNKKKVGPCWLSHLKYVYL